MEQSEPASLLRTLLLIAGIEPNPGPRIVYICSVCKKTLSSGLPPVRCNHFMEWCHEKVLTPDNAAPISLHDSVTILIYKQNYISSQSNTPTSNRLTNPLTSQSTHQSSVSSEPNINIMQLNCDGLRNKLPEILHVMEQNNIQIVAIQETKLSSNININAHSFTVVREDREKDKGLAFLVHVSIKFRIVSLPPRPLPIPL